MAMHSESGGGFISTSKDGGGGGWENLRLWSTSQWNNITGKSANEAAKQAAKAAEKARVQSIISEMGEREQADNMAYASAMSGKAPGNTASQGNNQSPGLVGVGAGQGTIGANISAKSNAGTF